jgi:hypothetical protein
VLEGGGGTSPDRTRRHASRRLSARDRGRFAQPLPRERGHPRQEPRRVHSSHGPFGRRMVEGAAHRRHGQHDEPGHEGVGVDVLEGACPGRVVLAATAAASSPPSRPGNPPHANEAGGRKTNILVARPGRSFRGRARTRGPRRERTTQARTGRSSRVTLCQRSSPGRIMTSSPHNWPIMSPLAVTFAGTSSQASTGGPLRLSQLSEPGEYALVCSE